MIKGRIARYWSKRAEGFETQRLREYESEKRERWLSEFRKYLPAGRRLRILDVGTGTGFFACLLAAEYPACLRIQADHMTVMERAFRIGTPDMHSPHFLITLIIIIMQIRVTPRAFFQLSGIARRIIRILFTS